MLADYDRKAILRCARKYGVSSVFLFGSSIGSKNPSDIDLAVRGLPPRLFFRFYAELIKNLSKPVDLIDLSKKTLFNRIIEEDGRKIYG